MARRSRSRAPSTAALCAACAAAALAALAARAPVRVAAAVEGTQAPRPECRGGNVYHECGRECFCPTDGGDKDVLVCTNIACRPGCYCPEGLLRADDGQCFAPEKCPSGQFEGFLWL